MGWFLTWFQHRKDAEFTLEENVATQKVWWIPTSSALVAMDPQTET